MKLTHFIGGKEVEADTPFTSINPSNTDEVVSSYPAGGKAEVDLLIEGEDGYVLKGHSSMREISRDPTDLVAQAMSEHHYPDGYILFLGTLFAPTQDRDDPGRGFTHKVGDVVSISTPKLGKLVNRVTHSKNAPPWTLGIAGLMQNLAQRGLLG